MNSSITNMRMVTSKMKIVKCQHIWKKVQDMRCIGTSEIWGVEADCTKCDRKKYFKLEQWNLQIWRGNITLGEEVQEK